MKNRFKIFLIIVSVVTTSWSQVFAITSLSTKTGNNNAKRDIYISCSNRNYNNCDMKEIILSAPSYSRIVIESGVYYLDNPVEINKGYIEIIGKGRDNTIIYAKNPGKPIFVFKSNNLSIREISLDAQTNDSIGRATFAILVDRGNKNLNISKTSLKNTGASAIIAPFTANCIVRDNIIINAGDDAIKMKGSHLTIIDNIIIRFYDEGIDVGSGQGIAVIGNFIESGRIGIVVDDAINAVISDNIVGELFQEGIVLGSKAGGVVFRNTAKNSGGKGFNLYSPMLVDSNRVEGKNKIGFFIKTMNKGVIQKNIILGAEIGIKIDNSNYNILNRNEYCDRYGTAIVKGKKSQENIIVDDIKKCSDCLEHYYNKPIGSSENKNLKIVNEIRKTISESFQNNLKIEIEGKMKKDLKIAKSIAYFLEINNPGFLSIKVNNDIMTSQITEEIYTILKGGDKLARGVIRYPFLEFKGRSGSWFPIWNLNVGIEKVAIVTRTHGGSKVRILFTEKGKLSFKNFVIYSASYVYGMFMHFLTNQ